MTPNRDGPCLACGRQAGGAGRAVVVVLLCAALLGGGAYAALRAAFPATSSPPPAAAPEPQPVDNWVERLREDLTRYQKDSADLREQNRVLQARVEQLLEEQKEARASSAAQTERLREQARLLREERASREREAVRSKRQVRLAEDLASLREEQLTQMRQQFDRLAQVKEAAAQGPKTEEQPQEADPRLKAAFIRIAEKMKQDTDPRAWAKLELHEREEVLEVLYKFVYFRYHKGNGLDGLSMKEVEFLKRAGLGGYVRMEEARRRPGPP
jgi:hypothetical protein